jgi:hypothetical protein
MTERDQVEEWDDIKNVKTMYRYAKADRDGWRDLFIKQERFSFQLCWSVLAMAPFSIYGVYKTIAWLINHVHIS